MVDKITIPNADKGPSLEEQAAAQEAAAAAAKDDAPPLAGEGEGTPEDRPEWLPEKFKTPEDLAKAYAELEKARSKGEASPEDAGEADEAAKAAVNEAGLDMEALSAEYATNGELTQESLDKLSAVGITPDMVEAYAAGQKAQAAAVEAELLEPVGGDIEVYSEMTQWAAENYTETEINNFNTVLESGNTAAIKMAVQNLATKYNEANGTEPGRQLTGKGTGGVSVYESTADLMKDMQNPEYHKNPAFRAKVEQKLARSSIL